MRDLPHPSWAKNGETEKGHMTAVRSDLPGVTAHTAAGGPKGARGSVTSTGLDLRKRIPLTRFAAFCAAPPLKNRTAKQFGVAPAWPGPANYLISTLAPASSNFFLIVAASSSRVSPLISSRIVSPFDITLFLSSQF